MYIYMYIYIYICIYIHTYISMRCTPSIREDEPERVGIRTYVSAHLFLSLSLYIYICVYMCIYLSIHVCMYLSLCRCTYIHIYIYMYALHPIDPRGLTRQNTTTTTRLVLVRVYSIITASRAKIQLQPLD